MSCGTKVQNKQATDCLQHTELQWSTSINMFVEETAVYFETVDDGAHLFCKLHVLSSFVPLVENVILLSKPLSNIFELRIDMCIVRMHFVCKCY
jgi:hypothetical protein